MRGGGLCNEFRYFLLLRLSRARPCSSRKTTSTPVSHRIVSYRVHIVSYKSGAEQPHRMAIHYRLCPRPLTSSGHILRARADNVAGGSRSVMPPTVVVKPLRVVSGRSTSCGDRKRANVSR